MVLLGTALIQALSGVDVSSQLFEILRNLCHGRCRVKGGYLLVDILKFHCRGDVVSLEGTQLHFVFALPVQIWLASAIAVQM